MSEIDTAAIRELVGDYAAIPPAPRVGPGWTDIIRNLCDALDEARNQVVCWQESSEFWQNADFRARQQRDEAVAQRDAYRKAKQENDERFQLEAGAQRARAEKAEAAIVRVRALCKNSADRNSPFVYRTEILAVIGGEVS